MTGTCGGNPAKEWNAKKKTTFRGITDRLYNSEILRMA